MSVKPPPSTALNAVMAVEDSSTAYEVGRYAVLRPWLDGDQPFLVEAWVEHSTAIADLLPPEFTIVRAATDEDSVALHAVAPGATIVIEGQEAHTRIRVCATTNERATELTAQLRERAVAAQALDRVRVRLWSERYDGGSWEDRVLVAPQWSDIARNYPSPVRDHLEPIYGLTSPPEHQGHLLLWYGPPGTGKTTAIRALARAWEPWCAVQYITDPERLFTEAQYLSAVIRKSARDPQGPTLTSPSQPDKTWKLIVAEDADEYLRANAAQEAGAALGRVLNLSDGLLGQQRNVLLLLTTNEEITRLHPAIVRPGRAMASVEFRAFGPKEAGEWLGPDHQRPSTAQTLAQLLVKRGDITTTTDEADQNLSIGAYL